MDRLHEFCERQRFVDFAGRMVYREDGQAEFNFGKHKGRLVTEVLRAEPSYYAWMMNGDFPMYTKRALTRIREAMG